jgi:preprotein translocase subunit Sss1
MVSDWLSKHPKAKEWLWFLGLWLAGLCAVTLIAYPIKLIMWFAK